VKEHNWRLPDGVEEVLPPAARALELLRRQILDLFDAWGYDYVVPPMIEYLDALLVGSGSDLELQTFRMVDQLSGRMLGIRADMTSQAARIDAHSLRTDATQRLCYAGTVVHANPQGVLESRVPLMAGAEIYGAAGLDADAEVISLMIEALRLAGVDWPVIELGHQGIFRAITADAGCDEALESALFEALQRKSQPDLEALLSNHQMDDRHRELFTALPDLLGSIDLLARARKLLSGLSEAERALDELEQLSGAVKDRCVGQELRYDLCELTGYGYHAGVVFAAYSADFGRAIARGGRYEAIGEAFGRARPATGFDLDLRRLSGAPLGVPRAVWAPALNGYSDAQRSALWQAMTQLRQQGERVIGALAANETSADDCDRELVWRDEQWQTEILSSGADDGT
jgi:ATP phosphoribosyltransferase regulatory subunit